jgi:hypothetical protein
MRRLSFGAADAGSPGRAGGYLPTMIEGAGTDLQRELTTRGIVALEGCYPPSVVAALNDRLDPLFDDAAGEPRAYVGADALAEIGALEGIFSAPVRAAIDALYVGRPPVLYHCHVYEIAGGQDRPHIRDRTLAGWHRDSETVPAFRRLVADYVSMFTYLSDVGPGAGAFEFVPQPPIRPPGDGTPCVSVHGGAGFTFLWNRSYFHRASPNRSSARRRVLKLSLQPADLPNERLHGPELAAARERVGDDAWLHALFGGPRDARPTVETAVRTRTLCPNAEAKLRPAQVASYHVAELGRSLARRARTRRLAPARG